MAIFRPLFAAIQKNFLNLTKITLTHFSLLLLYNLNPVKDAFLFGFNKVDLYQNSNKKKNQKVKIVKNVQNSETNYHCLLFAHNYINYTPPVLVSLYVIIESLVILYQAGFHFSTNSLPNFFSHRLMLQAIWPIGDAVVLMAFANAIFVFTSLFFDPMFSPKLIMYLFDKNEKNSTKSEKTNSAIVVQNGKGLSIKI